MQLYILLQVCILPLTEINDCACGMANIFEKTAEIENMLIKNKKRKHTHTHISNQQIWSDDLCDIASWVAWRKMWLKHSWIRKKMWLLFNLFLKKIFGRWPGNSPVLNPTKNLGTIIENLLKFVQRTVTSWTAFDTGNWQNLQELNNEQWKFRSLFHLFKNRF